MFKTFGCLRILLIIIIIIIIIMIINVIYNALYVNQLNDLKVLNAHACHVNLVLSCGPC